MTRQEEIKYLIQHLANVFYTGANSDLESLFKQMADWMDEHPKNPWISVNDRLPKVGDFVFVHTNLNFIFCATRNYRDEMTGVGFVVPIGYFDYWMPIPELPKGGEE